MPGQILEGIRILDLSTGMAGPVAAMMLAESGADVVKIEPPSGDPTRSRAGFAVWNRSKRSCVLDLATDGGRSELAKLLTGADVVIHDLGPKAAEARGLDDAILVAAQTIEVVSNPRLGDHAGSLGPAPVWSPK